MSASNFEGNERSLGCNFKPPIQELLVCLHVVCCKKIILTLDVGTFADLGAGVLIWVSISVNAMHVIAKLRLSVKFQ